jgi:hypothetical protein
MGNDWKIRTKHDFAAMKSWGIHVVTQMSTRLGSLFLSDGQCVSSPMDRCLKLLLSILNSSHPLDVMSLDLQLVYFAL